MKMLFEIITITVLAAGAFISSALAAPQVRQRQRFMGFLTPNQESIWNCGNTEEIRYRTFGKGSTWGTISMAALTLVKMGTDDVTVISQGRLSEFLKEERLLGTGKPLGGSGSFSWEIPTTISSGYYVVKFESHNRYDERGIISITSTPFRIQCGEGQVQNPAEAQNESETEQRLGVGEKI